MSHQTISFIKSGIRIVGYIALMHAGVFFGITSLFLSGIILVISEALGIYEEVGH